MILLFLFVIPYTYMAFALPPNSLLWDCSGAKGPGTMGLAKKNYKRPSPPPQKKRVVTFHYIVSLLLLELVVLASL